MTNVLNDGQSNNLVKKKYLTGRLIEKIERMVYVTGADPVIRAQDITNDAIETLSVIHLDKYWYMVDYMWHKNDVTSHNKIPVKVAIIEDRFMIDYITPEWNGLQYGDTLLCDEITQKTVIDNNPRFMLETFYESYTSLYYSMREGLLSQLEELRTVHLTPNALEQFDMAKNEFKLDGLKNYDLLIDNFDFDCKSVPSISITLLNGNTFKVDYKQGELGKSILIGLISDGGKYKIDKIHVEK